MSSRTLDAPTLSPEIDLLPGAISEIFASASETGVLTISDRYGLMAATLNDELNEEETLAVNRLLRAVCRGKVKILIDPD